MVRPIVYVDSCVFFHVIKQERGLWRSSLQVLLAAERGDISLVASTLVLAEVGGWHGDVSSDVQEKVIERYLLGDSVGWVEVDLFTVDAARGLARDNRLRGADAVHLASAIRAKASHLMTNDERLLSAAAPGVEVCRPRVVWQATLEDEEIELAASDDE